ncbi:hypothetical protein ALC57_04986 [Trachymyrmex cornetzi]|uniref:Mos1 transposase HTH domain-containing protein n=1 Tax=Trachymyrmex cornetzi TaxID=471704 RepID=A0A151JBX9_9HYME|nr:hypothetical protein ALC57_04986 [Trachymyrmex cornetzi]
MKKIEYRAINKFLHLKGNTSTQIKAELDAVYGDSAPSFATVKRWVAEFKRGRTSLANDEHSGRLTTATITDNIEEIHQMIMDNRRIKIREIAEKFSSNEEVIASVDAYFVKQDAQYYLNGLKGWEHRWKKCIDLKEDGVIPIDSPITATSA